MKYNLLPLCMTLMFVACNKGKDVKVLDGGTSVARSVPALDPVVNPNASGDEKPAPPALPEAKFCDKGQTFKADMAIDKDFMDYEGKLVVAVATFKKSKEVKIYFQEGMPMKKESLDRNKIFCQVTAHLNPKLGKRSYKITGSVASDKGEEKVEHQSICRQSLIDTSDIKNGEGMFTEIACTKVDDSELKVEDVRDAVGESSIVISDAVSK